MSGKKSNESDSKLKQMNTQSVQKIDGEKNRNYNNNYYNYGKVTINEINKNKLLGTQKGKNERRTNKEKNGKSRTTFFEKIKDSMATELGKIVFGGICAGIVYLFSQAISHFTCESQNSLSMHREMFPPTIVRESNNESIRISRESIIEIQQKQKVSEVIADKNEVEERKNNNSNIEEVISTDVENPESVQENEGYVLGVDEEKKEITQDLYVLNWDKDIYITIPEGISDTEVVEGCLLPQINQMINEKAAEKVVATYTNQQLNQSEYALNAKQANALYEEYKNNSSLSFEQQSDLLSKAVEYRKLADEAVETALNQENLANDYYALGIECYKLNLEEKAFDYFQKSISWYISSMAINSAREDDSRERYYNVGMCFDNISNLENLSETDKKYALLMAATCYEGYYRENQEKYENNLYLGTVYYKLMKMADDEEAFYFYMKAKELFSKCVGIDDLQVDKMVRIYEYLGDAVAYCILNIDSKYYSEGITKTTLQEQKAYYDKQKENYESLEK